MLPKIRCEICGGKLLGIPKSLFLCKACGVEYSIEWAREKYCEAEGLISLRPVPNPLEDLEGFDIDDPWSDNFLDHIELGLPRHWTDEGNIDPPEEFLKRLPVETEKPEREAYWLGQYDSVPIEWMVLEKNEDRALLISKYTLKLGCFDSKGGNTRWESCSLRKWLNETFYSEAFSDQEQEMILTCDVPPCDSVFYRGTPGETVKDKLFLLSISEAKQYFANDEDRICYLGPKSPDPDKPYYWWLRSMGASEENPSMVRDTGEIYDLGSFPEHNMYTIRPAMWIRLK